MKIRSTLSGRDFTIDGNRLRKYNKLIAKLGFKLTDVPTGVYWHSPGKELKPDGMVTNADELNTKVQARAAVRIQRALVATQQRNLTQRLRNAQIHNTVRLARLNDAVLTNFIDSIRSWPEVIEAGRTGDVLNTTPTHLRITDTMGVRFWPTVMYERDRNERIPRWILTPPIAFNVGAGITASGAEHPHIYPAGHTLCHGGARWQYGNPIQMMPVLREWYVGHSERDAANHDYTTTSRVWWRAYKDTMLSLPDPKCILAAYEGHETARVVPLTPERVDMWLNSTGWVADDPDFPTPRMLAGRGIHPTITLYTGAHIITATRRLCVECGQRVHLTATYDEPQGQLGTREFLLCGCDASVLPNFHGTHDFTYTGVPIQLTPMSTRDIQLTGYVCEFPICGVPSCVEHGAIANGRPASHTLNIPGYRTYHICRDHAAYIRRAHATLLTTNGKEEEVTPRYDPLTHASAREHLEERWELNNTHVAWHCTFEEDNDRACGTHAVLRADNRGLGLCQHHADELGITVADARVGINAVGVGGAFVDFDTLIQAIEPTIYPRAQ